MTAQSFCFTEFSLAGHDGGAVGGGHQRVQLGVARRRTAGRDVAADVGAAAVLGVDRRTGVAVIDHGAALEGGQRVRAAGLGAGLGVRADSRVAALLAGGPAAVAVPENSNTVALAAHTSRKVVVNMPDS